MSKEVILIGYLMHAHDDTLLSARVMKGGSGWVWAEHFCRTPPYYFRYKWDTSVPWREVPAKCHTNVVMCDATPCLIFPPPKQALQNLPPPPKFVNLNNWKSDLGAQTPHCRSIHKQEQGETSTDLLKASRGCTRDSLRS